jgi:hypothetical protein
MGYSFIRGLGFVLAMANASMTEAATIFYDSFTTVSNTPLDSHPPDTGTGWTLLIDVGSAKEIDAYANDDARASAGGSSNDSGKLYTADASGYTSNYEVKVTLLTADADEDEPTILAARIQDASNMYAVQFSGYGGQLWKKTSGTWSTLGSSFGSVGVGSVVTLKVDGSTISVLDDAVVAVSVTDTDHSAAGSAGLGMGAVVESADDYGNNTRYSRAVTGSHRRSR